MNSDQFNILIVDDAEENRFMLETMLEDDFSLGFAASGKECLDSLGKDKPDLILLDVTMPDMTGLEVCKELKGQGDNSGIPVIFVSGLVSNDERLAGFEAGGDEYITKPVDEEELKSKIKISLDAKVISQELKASADNAMNIAMEAMVSSSELGVLNQFMRDSALATSYEGLGSSLLDVASHFGLNCCLQFRPATGLINISCETDSLEVKLLEKFRSGDKFTDFGARTVVNSPNIGLLIKNMPLEDEAKCGRIRDHLAVLIDTASAKVTALELAQSIVFERERMIIQLVENNDNQLVDIRTKVSGRDEYTLNVMREVISGVEAQLFSLGLEEDQEKTLIKMLDDGLAKIENLPDFSGEIEASFAAAKDVLGNLLEQ